MQNVRSLIERYWSKNHVNALPAFVVSVLCFVLGLSLSQATHHKKQVLFKGATVTLPKKHRRQLHEYVLKESLFLVSREKKCLKRLEPIVIQQFEKSYFMNESSLQAAAEVIDLLLDRDTQLVPRSKLTNEKRCPRTLGVRYG